MRSTKKPLLIIVFLLFAILGWVLLGSLLKQRTPPITSSISEFNNTTKPKIKETVFTNANAAVAKQQSAIVQQEIIIKFHPGKQQQFAATGYGLFQPTLLTTDTYVYKFDQGINILQLMEQLYSDENIKYSEPNYTGQLSSANLKEFSSSKYKFSFSYPSSFKSCCNLSGPVQQSVPLIVLANIDLDKLGSDQPFDGLGAFIIENITNFNSLINDEKQALQARSEAMGQPANNNASQRNTTVRSIVGTELVQQSWDNLNRIYLQLPDSNNVLVIAYHYQFTGISDILSSFRFGIQSQPRLTNDPVVNKQWSLNNNNGVDINTEEAWQIEGDFEPVIAVVDTGIMLEHEDITGQIWINTDETPGNNIDDDNNGFIDDVNGYNFTNNNTVINGANPHGTWTSGIIGAKRNNAKGIAGICGKCKIMPLVFYIEMAETEEQAQFNVATAMRAFDYEQNNGARVISNSWTMNYYSQAMQDQINDLRASNILVIAAAGNGGSDSDSGWYPAQMQNVIAVGAVSPDGKKSPASNYGNWIDIAAPATAVPLMNPYSGTPVTSDPLEVLYSTDAYIQEGSSGGTSIATPHIAGVAGLLLTRNIDLTAEQLERLILDNTNQHVQTEYILGRGIVNAEKAMQATFNL